MAFLALIPTAWRIGLIVAVAVSFIGFCTYERAHLINEGTKAELQKIEDANAVEQASAKAGSDAVDACAAAGRTWDRALGTCGN